MTYILFIYTALLLFTTIYFVLLKYFHFRQYLESYFNFMLNFNTYLIIIYLLAFLISLILTLFVWSADLAGERIAYCLIHNPHILVESDSTAHPVSEIKNSETNSPLLDDSNRIVVHKENSSLDNEKQTENKSNRINSPIETNSSPYQNGSLHEEKSMLQKVVSYFPQKVPLGRELCSSHDFAKQTYLNTAQNILDKSPTKPEDQKVIMDILTRYSSEEAKSSTYFGTIDPNDLGYDTPQYSVKAIRLDGSCEKISCVNLLKTMEFAEQSYKLANQLPKLSYFGKVGVGYGLHVMGLDQTRCISLEQGLPNPVLENQPSINEPDSPSSSPNNLF